MATLSVEESFCRLFKFEEGWNANDAVVGRGEGVTEWSVGGRALVWVHGVDVCECGICGEEIGAVDVCGVVYGGECCGEVPCWGSVGGRRELRVGGAEEGGE
eukprot:3935838-Rhodomonas_salina.1